MSKPITCVYILECSDNTFYTGSTKDLEARFEQHALGMGANYTKKRLPVSLAYYEEYESVADAFEREKQIQRWGHSKKKALALRNINRLKRLAECSNDSHFAIQRFLGKYE